MYVFSLITWLLLLRCDSPVQLKPRWSAIMANRWSFSTVTFVSIIKLIKGGKKRIIRIICTIWILLYSPLSLSYQMILIWNLMFTKTPVSALSMRLHSWSQCSPFVFRDETFLGQRCFSCTSVFPSLFYNGSVYCTHIKQKKIIIIIMTITATVYTAKYDCFSPCWYIANFWKPYISSVLLQ